MNTHTHTHTSYRYSFRVIALPIQGFIFLLSYEHKAVVEYRKKTDTLIDDNSILGSI